MANLAAQKILGRDATDEELAAAIAQKPPQISPRIPAKMMWFTPRFKPLSGGLSEEDKLTTALCFSLTVIARHKTGGGVYIPELDPELQRAYEIVSPDFELQEKGGTKRFKGFRVEPSDDHEVYRLYFSGPKAAGFITTCIATNIQMGIPLAGSLKIIAAGLVSGTLKRTSASPIKPKLDHRDTLFVLIVNQIKSDLGLEGGASKSKFEKGDLPPIRGCTIAAAAMSALGIKMTAQSSLHIWQSKRKTRLLKAALSAPRDILSASESDISNSKDVCPSSPEFAAATRFFSTPIK